MHSAALSSLAVATLLLPAAPTLAQSGDAARIDRMTMSSGGVAEVHRVVDVDGDGVMRIDVPVAQVDDVLKSLLVQDPQGALVSVTLAGPAPVQEAFSALPFTAESLGSPADLLKGLPGTRVRASSGGRTIEGAVLGTNTVERKDTSGEVLPVSTLSVLTEDKRIDTLRLGPDTSVDILDASMRDRVAAAVAALGKSDADQFRTVEIAVKGKGKRSVGLDYVSTAPVWKPAFRLVLGKDGHARLQGWAVLENATGQDWKDVDLTLMSGAPVTLTQKLYERYWRERPELPVVAGASDVPRTDDSAELGRGGGAMEKSDYANARRSMVAMAAPPSPMPIAGGQAAPMAAMSPPVAVAAARESDINVSFHLPDRITLARGQTLSVPFLDVEVPAERLALFQPDMGTHNPVSAVMLKNTSGSSLPPGILTVYAAGSGFVGDAQMPAVPASEQRLASFAADRKVEISSEMKPDQRITRVTVSKGVLNAETLSRRVTTYTVKGAADAPRTVVIEHRRFVGWTTQSAQLDTTTAAYQRLRVQVGAGAVVQVEATDERPETTTYELGRADERALLIWSNAPATPELSAKLKELAQQRHKLALADQELVDLQLKLTHQSDDQARLRENLGAVPQDSELGRRYLDLMAASENAIASLATQRDTAKAARDALDQAFDRALSSL